MNHIKLSIPEVILIEPILFKDDRGYFYESFNQREFNKITGLEYNFVQDNQSKSIKNVIRGLHYQQDPYAQGKLVRAVSGEIFDVAVDIRIDSPTYGKWVSAVLSSDNNKQLWIPPGFAHGFAVLSDTAEVVYKTTEFYNPSADKCIVWNDPTLAITWLVKNPILSIKDMNGSQL